MAADMGIPCWPRDNSNFTLPAHRAEVVQPEERHGTPRREPVSQPHACRMVTRCNTQRPPPRGGAGPESRMNEVF